MVLKWVFAQPAHLPAAGRVDDLPHTAGHPHPVQYWMILVAAFVFAGIAFGLFVGAALEAEARARQDDR